MACDFLVDVVHAVQIKLGIFETRFRQPFLGLELGDPRGFFDDRAPVGGTAGKDLAYAPLLDQSIGLRSETRPHEKFLDVTQTAELAIQQVLAIAGAKQPAGDDDFATVELLLGEFTAADLEYHGRSRSVRGFGHC